MSKLLKNFIAPQQRQPEHYAFGAKLAEVVREEANPGGSYELSEHAQYLARGLRRSAFFLLQSTEREDRESVARINQTFTVHDGLAMKRQLLDQASFTPVSTIMPWLAEANPNDLAAFAQWNTDRRHTFQQQLNADQEELQNDTLEKVEHLTSIDFFPKRARKLFLAAMSHYGQFKAMDGIESGAEGASGYCSDTTIAIANLYMNRTDFNGITSLLQGTVFHEYLHGAGHHGRGFSNGISTPIDYKHLFEEMFAGHATAVATSAPGREDPAVFHPYRRDFLHINHYPRERELMDYMIDGAIKPEKVAAAFFSRRDSKKGIAVRAEVEKDFFRFFTPSTTAIDLVNNYSRAKTSADRQYTITKAIGEVLHTQRHYSDETSITDDIIPMGIADDLAVVKDLDSSN